MELKFAILFTAVDRMTDIAGRIGESLGEIGEKAESAGERLTGFGERLALQSALIGEGAERLSEWSEKITEPAIGMSDAIAHLSAVSGLAGESLAKVKEAAVDFSNLHPGATAEEYVAAFGPMLQVFHDTDQALNATSTAVKLAELTHASAAETGSLLTTVYANLGAPVKQTGDIMAAAVRQFKIGGEDLPRFSMALSRIAGMAKGTGTSLADLTGLVAESSTLGGGGRGAMRITAALQEFVQKVASGKVGGVDLSGGLIGALEQVHARVANMSGPNLLRELQELGFGTQAANILPLLDNLDKLRNGIAAMKAQAPGALDVAVKLEESGAGKRMEALRNNLSNMFDAMASPALPVLNTGIEKLTQLFERLGKFFDAHPTIGGVFVTSLTMAALGLGAIVSILSVSGTVFTLAGQGIVFFGKAWSLLSNVGGIIRGLLPLIASFDVAMLANPMVWIPAAIIAVAGLAYAIYRYWGPITGFASNLWGGIKTVFNGASDWMRTAGVTLVKSLGEGILSAIEWPGKAAAAVAEHVMAFFRGHSPPVVGPLRDLGKLKLVQTIAETMEPGPAIEAARRIAAAVMSSVQVAAKHVAGVFPSQLPPVLTLGDQDKLKPARTIADRMQPSPMIDAAKRIAGVVMLSAPMIAAPALAAPQPTIAAPAPAFTAPPMVAGPAFGPPAQADRANDRRPAVSLVVQVAPANITIHAGPGTDFDGLRESMLAALRSHDVELERALEQATARALERRQRVEF